MIIPLKELNKDTEKGRERYFNKGCKRVQQMKNRN